MCNTYLIKNLHTSIISNTKAGFFSGFVKNFHIINNISIQPASHISFLCHIFFRYSHSNKHKPRRKSSSNISFLCGTC